VKPQQPDLPQTPETVTDLPVLAGYSKVKSPINMKAVLENVPESLRSQEPDRSANTTVIGGISPTSNTSYQPIDSCVLTETGISITIEGQTDPLRIPASEIAELVTCTLDGTPLLRVSGFRKRFFDVRLCPVKKPPLITAYSNYYYVIQNADGDADRPVLGLLNVHDYSLAKSGFLAFDKTQQEERLQQAIALFTCKQPFAQPSMINDVSNGINILAKVSSSDEPFLYALGKQDSHLFQAEAMRRLESVTRAIINNTDQQTLLLALGIPESKRTTILSVLTNLGTIAASYASPQQQQQYESLFNQIQPFLSELENELQKAVIASLKEDTNRRDMKTRLLPLLDKCKPTELEKKELINIVSSTSCVAFLAERAIIRIMQNES